VVDRTAEPEPVMYVRLNDALDLGGSEGNIKLNNNKQQQQQQQQQQQLLAPYKLPGLVEAAMSLAQEEGFLPAFSNTPYTTSHQVRFRDLCPQHFFHSLFPSFCHCSLLLSLSSFSVFLTFFHFLSFFLFVCVFLSYRPPLCSSGQNSCLLTRDPRFDSRRCQIF
jgi:hypothetical protein